MSTTNHAVNIIVAAKDMATRQFGHISKGFGGMVKTLAGIGAAVGGVMGVYHFIKSSYEAAAEAEVATRRLSDALSLLGASDQLGGLEELTKQIQNVTTVEDEAVKQAMATGAAMGLSGDTLKAATMAATGFSAAFGISVEDAMQKVGLAAQGNTRALKKMGVVIDDSMTTQEKFQAVLRAGVDKFAMAEGKTHTFRGIIAQMGNAWKDAKESLGSYIVQNEYLRTGLQGVVFGFRNFGDLMQWVWTSAALSMVTWWEDLKHMFTVQIPEVLSWFGRNWKEVFIDIFNMMKNFSINVATNMINLFKSVWSWAKGDGWNFEWTPLLDGFESAIKELPEITKRGMTDVEKALLEEQQGISERLSQAWEEQKNNGGKLAGGMAGAIENAEALSSKNKDKGGKAEKDLQSTYQVFESRTMSGTRTKSPESRQLDTMIDLLARIATRAEKQDEHSTYGRHVPAFAVTNFR